MRVGSLCTGYGGLDLALGGETVFVSEIDKDANTVIAHRFAGVPNLGDFTQLDSLPECDILTAGFPCQPVSQAGKRAGTDDERWLWDDIERVVGGMGRPPAVLFLENVRGLLTANGGDAMGRVVSGLARLGYVGRYRLVAAADVGACHRRERVFIVATHASHVGHERGGSTRDRWAGLADGGGVAAHAGGPGLEGHGRPVERPRELAAAQGGGESAAHTDCQRREGWQVRHVGTERERQPERVARMDTERSGVFGPYWPAVARWERVIGRSAPDPTIADADSPRRREVTGGVRSDAPEPAGRTTEHDHVPVGASPKRNGPGSPRLNPRFVEWMMGLPDGWVTDTGVSRTAQLKILGNGVVPQQARLAFEILCR